MAAAAAMLAIRWRWKPEMLALRDDHHSEPAAVPSYCTVTMCKV